MFAGFSNPKSGRPMKRILLEWTQGFLDGWGPQGLIGKRKKGFEADPFMFAPHLRRTLGIRLPLE
jgi:hypothetical protein